MSADDDQPPAPGPESSEPDGVPGPSASPPTPDCPQAHETLLRFVGGGVSVEEERWLRAHLTSCPTCRDEYRASVRSAAVLGRAQRLESEVVDE